MILHIEFTDGSNPWVSYPADRHILKKRWEEWERSHPWTTRATAYNGSYIAQRASDFSCYWVWKSGDYLNTRRKYKHLGHALAALDRLGAKQ